MSSSFTLPRCIQARSVSRLVRYIAGGPFLVLSPIGLMAILLSHDSGSRATSRYKQGQAMGQLDGVSMTTTQMTVLTMSLFQSHLHPKGCQSGDNRHREITINSLVI
jgi:hypothetical protein